MNGAFYTRDFVPSADAAVHVDRGRRRIARGVGLAMRRRKVFRTFAV
jgi:hypothetical protein